MVIAGRGDFSKRRATQSALARSTSILTLLQDLGVGIGNSESAFSAPGAETVRELPGCSKRHGPESGNGISSGALILPSLALSRPLPRTNRGRGRLQERRERKPTAARASVKDARKSVARLAALAGALAIAGCAAGARPAPPAPLMVQVPVLHQMPCPAPTLARPALPLAGLEAGSPPADTIRAYAAAVAILKGAVRERDAVLAGCARAESAAPAPVENVQ